MQPAVDLETLFRSDRKVTVGGPPTPPEDPDLPADSFQIRIADGFDWSGLGAAVFNREYSTRGSTNPKSLAHSNANPNHNPPSTSQRFTANTKSRAPIIGLPNKVDPAAYVRRPGNARGHRRAGPAPAVAEPASPKVSCFGRVSSEKEPDFRRRSEDTRCWEGIPWILGICSGRREAEEEVMEAGSMERGRNIPAAMAAPGVGGMQELASGRRAESWGRAFDVDADGHAAR